METIRLLFVGGGLLGGALALHGVATIGAGGAAPAWTYLVGAVIGAAGGEYIARLLIQAWRELP